MANNDKIGLHNLTSAPGSHRARRRLGRGPGSGLGKTSGKGHKGSMARACFDALMALARRLARARPRTAPEALPVPV